MATLTWTMPGDDLDDFVLADSASSAPSTLVPGTYPIAIKGHPYKLELDSYGTGIRGVTYRRTTLDVFRQAADQSATPGEQSRSTEGYWMRSQRTWLYGAGQLIFDSLDTGIDNLIARQRWRDNWNCEPDDDEGLLMMRAAQSGAFAAPAVLSPFINGNLTVQAGQYTYMAFFGGGSYSALRIDPGVGVTTCTGFGSDQPRAIASDGYNVWVLAQVTSSTTKWYSTTAGSTVFSALGAGGATSPGGTIGVGMAFFGNGFLLATMAGTISSTNSSGTATLVDTVAAVSGTSQNCVAITATTSRWYFAFVSSGDWQTTIYKLGLDSAGAFTKVSVALPPLPGNEKVTALHAVSGSVLLIGTNRGFRLAVIDSSGNLSTGPLVALGAGVTSFAWNGTKVLAAFTTDPYDSGTNTTVATGSEAGLVAIDPGHFAADLQPAWWFWWRNLASAPTTIYVGQNQTSPVVIADDTIYTLGTTNLISPCSLVTSWISYGLDASKSFIDIEVFHDPLVTGDSVKVYYQVEDSTTWNLIGTSQAVGSISNPDPFQLTTSSRRVRFAFVMTAGSTSQATTPRIRRWELRAFPAPKLTDEIMLPIVLFDSVLVGEQEAVAAHLATRDEYDFLAGLAQSGEIVIFQEGSHTEQVKVSKLELQPAKFSIDPDGGYGFYQGWCVVRLLSL